jgi:hypothetical protein
MNEINKKIDINDAKLNDEVDKYKRLREEFQRVLKEKETLKDELELNRIQYLEKIDFLNKELNEAANLARFSNHQQAQAAMMNNAAAGGGDSVLMKRRSNNNNDDYSTIIKEQEVELKQLRIENHQLNNQIAELNAQLLRSDLENGRSILRHLNATNNSSAQLSFAAEINTMSKDDVIIIIMN